MRQLRNPGFFGHFERTLEPFLHGSIAVDPVTAERHRSFIAAHMLSGILAFTLLPLCLAFDSSKIAAVALAILGLEGFAALYVSRTGQLNHGFLISAAILSALVAWVSIFTGGVASFALVWFAIVPLEAAISGSRRVILSAAVIALGAYLAVIGVPMLIPAIPSLTLPVSVTAAAGVMALIYAAGLALRVHRQQAHADQRAEVGEDRYRMLAGAMTDIITCHDARGDVSFATPATERLLGIRPSALLVDGLFQRVHIADRPAYLTALSDALHNGHAAVEFRLRKGDMTEEESWIWCEALIRRSDDNKSAENSCIAVTRDISHRKSQEIELGRAREDAEAASQAKTRFLANISHELRTPLNAIIGFSDMLEQEIFGKFELDRHREYSHLIKESGEHLLQVVNDILDMSKIEAGSFDVTKEPFNMAQVAQRCQMLMEPQALAAGVELALEVGDDLPELVADRRACRQILLNLLSNSVKFTNPGGKITCQIRHSGRHMILSVRDNGIGISAADLPRLGKPFVQADSGYDRRHAGTGLGLSVVKGLVSLHSGTLSIDSTLGSGTVVTILLPINGERDPVPLSQRLHMRPQPIARRA